MFKSYVKYFSLVSTLLIYPPVVLAQSTPPRETLRPIVAAPSTTLSSIDPSTSRELPYTLGAGDLINLEIFNVPEYSKEYQVLIDGTINLPLLNSIRVENLTLPEVSDLVRREYTRRGFLRDPIVAANLVRPRPVNVTIVGEVRTPGSYVVPFTGETGGSQSIKFPNIIQALELARGINASANTRQVQVIRLHKGQELNINVNLWDFLDRGDSRQNILLRDGDRIIIPSAANLDPDEVYRMAVANFSANLSIPISVTVVGEVNRPGPYTLSGSDVRSDDLSDSLRFQGDRFTSQESLAGIPTVSRAIKTSGGLSARADIRNIEVRRQLPSGEQQIVTVDLWSLLETGNFRQDAILQNGDQIFIPTATAMDESEAQRIASASFSPNRIRVNVVGEVKNPGTKQLPPNVTLQQAILEAGSFDETRARKSTAQLIRLNPDGTVARRSIPIDFSAGINEEANPQLLNNDIVVVERSGSVAAADTLTNFFSPLSNILNLFGGVRRLFGGD